jgi:hypothetical protein
MDGLHWTGAALLLALAVLGGRTAPLERDPIVSWAEFAREHGLVVGDSPVVETAPRPESACCLGRSR